MITAASFSGANIILLQELWNAPFFLCTRETLPWYIYFLIANYSFFIQKIILTG